MFRSGLECVLTFILSLFLPVNKIFQNLNFKYIHLQRSYLVETFAGCPAGSEKASPGLRRALSDGTAPGDGWIEAVVLVDTLDCCLV